MNERIKELRKTLSLTMEELGEKLGVTRSTISNIESGKRGITKQMILAICREFEVNENWLRNGTGEMFQPIPKNGLEMLAKEHGLNQFEYLFLEDYLKLPDSDRKSVLNFVIDLLEKFSKTQASLEEAAIIGTEPCFPKAPLKESPAAELAKPPTKKQARKNAPTNPAADFEELTVDEKVELYRMHLELEEKAAEKSEVS